MYWCLFWVSMLFCFIIPRRTLTSCFSHGIPCLFVDFIRLFWQDMSETYAFAESDNVYCNMFMISCKKYPAHSSLAWMLR